MSPTTEQLRAEALDVPCPDHKVPAGHKCPQRTGTEEERASGACMTRRGLAEICRHIRETPGDMDKLGALNVRQLSELVLTLKGDCVKACGLVDLALRPFGVT